MSIERTKRIDITDDMVVAGVDANILHRGINADPYELVVEIYRAMESVRQGLHADQSADYQVP